MFIRRGIILYYRLLIAITPAVRDLAGFTIHVHMVTHCGIQYAPVLYQSIYRYRHTFISQSKISSSEPSWVRIGMVHRHGFMVASGGVLSEGYGLDGPGVCLGDGQTEPIWRIRAWRAWRLPGRWRRRGAPAYATIPDLTRPFPSVQRSQILWIHTSRKQSYAHINDVLFNTNVNFNTALA